MAANIRLFHGISKFLPIFLLAQEILGGEIEEEDDAGPGKGTQMPQMDTDISGSG